MCRAALSPVVARYAAAPSVAAPQRRLLSPYQTESEAPADSGHWQSATVYRDSRRLRSDGVAARAVLATATVSARMLTQIAGALDRRLRQNAECWRNRQGIGKHSCFGHCTEVREKAWASRWRGPTAPAAHMSAQADGIGGSAATVTASCSGLNRGGPEAVQPLLERRSCPRGGVGNDCHYRQYHEIVSQCS